MGSQTRHPSLRLSRPPPPPRLPLPRSVFLINTTTPPRPLLTPVRHVVNTIIDYPRPPTQVQGQEQKYPLALPLPFPTSTLSPPLTPSLPPPLPRLSLPRSGFLINTITPPRPLFTPARHAVNTTIDSPRPPTQVQGQEQEYSSPYPSPSPPIPPPVLCHDIYSPTAVYNI